MAAFAFLGQNKAVFCRFGKLSTENGEAANLATKIASGLIQRNPVRNRKKEGAMIRGLLVSNFLLSKIPGVSRGEYVMLESTLYEVHRVDRYNEWVWLTYHVNKYKRKTERMNMNYVSQRGFYLTLQCETNYYEIRIQPGDILNVLNAFYNRIPVEAETKVVKINDLPRTIAVLRFGKPNSNQG